MTWRITWLGSICATLLLVARVSATVYIDPSCAMQGDGSIGEPCAAAAGGAGPRNTWADMPWVSGETYAQKSNSTYVGLVDVPIGGASASERITLTSYGIGSRPRIVGAGQQFGIYLRGVAHVTIAGFDVSGVDAGSGNRFLVRLGNSAGQAASDIHLMDMVLHSPIDPGGSSEANGVWGYCTDCTFDRVQLYDIPSDGMWLANIGHFVLRDSHCHHVGTSGRNTGDCIQLGGTASSIAMQRNILDHSSTEAKQALMDATVGASFVLVEDNRFMMGLDGAQTTISKAVLLAPVSNLILRRNTFAGGDWNLGYSGSGEIYDNVFSGSRSSAWVVTGTGQHVHAYRNRFVGAGGVAVNASGGPGVVRLTENSISGYAVGVQDYDTIQIIDQANRMDANTRHAAGLMLDGSTYYGADKQTQWGN